MQGLGLVGKEGIHCTGFRIEGLGFRVSTEEGYLPCSVWDLGLRVLLFFREEGNT